MEMMQLPKNKDDLAEALESMRKAAWPGREQYRIQCMIAHYYLNGYRKFKLLENSRLMVGFENEYGDLKFRNEALRAQYRTELGRFLRMDLSPIVSPPEWGLDSLRKAAISQVGLDHATHTLLDNSVKADFCQQFLVFGTVGLCHWRTLNLDGAYESEYEAVPGWELLPMPKNPLTHKSVKGIMRYRYVPKKWLETKMGGDTKLRVPSNSADSMVVECAYGTAPDDMLGAGTSAQNFAGIGKDGRANGKQLMEEYVPLTEAWVYGPKDSVARYIVKVGKVIVADQDFMAGGRRIARPIGIARFTPTTGFYSYGLVGMLVGMNERNEKMLQNLFKNVEDLDAYGVLMWPATAGVGIEQINKKQGGRPRGLVYEPDYTVPDHKPYSVSPVNTGDFPGKVASMGLGLQETWAGQGPMTRGDAPGRVDSKPGLGMLFEVSQITNAAPAHQIADAYSTVYRSVLCSVKEDWSPTTTLRLTNVDDNVAGVVIGDDGGIALEDNPLPDYWEVKIDVKDRQPSSREKKTQELIMMRQMNEIDEVEFRLENYRQKLGLPVGNRQEYEEYRKAVFDNILMFNDGKTPKDLVLNTALDNPEIQLRAIRGFTSRLEFRFASKEVRDAFEQRKNVYEQMLGGWPDQMPPPEQVPQMQAPPQQAGGFGG